MCGTLSLLISLNRSLQSRMTIRAGLVVFCLMGLTTPLTRAHLQNYEYVAEPEPGPPLHPLQSRLPLPPPQSAVLPPPAQSAVLPPPPPLPPGGLPQVDPGLVAPPNIPRLLPSPPFQVGPQPSESGPELAAAPPPPLTYLQRPVFQPHAPPRHHHRHHHKREAEQDIFEQEGAVRNHAD